MYVCLWSPDWSIDGASVGEDGAGDSSAAGLSLVDVAPRVRVAGAVIWADGRGLDAAALAERLLARLWEGGTSAWAGVAGVAVVAEQAARRGWDGSGRSGAPTPFRVKERTGWGWRRDGVTGSPGSSCTEGIASRVVVVERGRERGWLGSLPVTALVRDARLRVLLDGVGVRTVGDLAVLEREAVEVRFGADAVELWRLARAEDRRLLFGPSPPERPHGAIDFVDYVLTDPARLLFTANALLGPLCDRLVERGEHARELRLVLPLANGETWERTLRPARPTASRDNWLRMVRGLLERLTVPDAVTGMHVEVGATEPAGVRQGDLFDRGFATASAVEAAVARLAERQAAPVAPQTNAHPLVERRAEWIPVGPEHEVSPGVTTARGLTLQLLGRPRPLRVESGLRRDHAIPERLHDGSGWRTVAVAAGPDRISGGRWEAEPYAREYYRCITDQGRILWIYRDGRDGSWYLHGWWD